MSPGDYDAVQALRRDIEHIKTWMYRYFLQLLETRVNIFVPKEQQLKVSTQ